jgi:hypothetical protein
MLEQAARRVCGAKDFTLHLAAVVDTYRYWHEFDKRRPGARNVRKALAEIRKHADAMEAWLKRAAEHNGGFPVTPEHDALSKISTMTAGTAYGHKRAVETLRATLVNISIGAARAAKELPPRSHIRSAPRMGADALQAVLQHHGIKSITTPVVSLFVAAAAAAGDRHLTPPAARKFLKTSRYFVGAKSRR